jgi:tRNA dimethylallyltransferase
MAPSTDAADGNALQPALVIGGPTASGKTDLAIALALRLGGEIVNGDAFQLYSGLGLLTAQPSSEHRARVPHHLFGELPLGTSMDASSYAQMAIERIRDCWNRGRPPVLVGGSGLYLRCVLQGLSKGLPAPNPELRAELESRSLRELCAELSTRDPEAAQKVDLHNPRRVIRALEVCLLTGKPFSSFRPPSEGDPSPAGIWLALPRETLHERIATRSAGLFAKGVAAEVEAAIPLLGKTAAQAIGLREIASVLTGQATEEEAILKIVQSTRQYARRQETWFRKEPALLLSSPDSAMDQALRIAAQRIARVLGE